jgi:DNA-binding beta-propeller fold protein YncE
VAHRPAIAAHGAECLVAWQVAGGTTCRDGDPACDADGVADGACTFATTLCVNVGECAGGNVGDLRIGGRAAAPLVRVAADLAYPVRGRDVCTAAAPVRVALGGRARRAASVWARARDATSGRTDRDRLRLTCRRARRPGAAKAVVVTTDFETGLLATVGVAPPHAVARLDVPIHADAVVRTAGDRVYVVNRFLGDNLQVLDPENGFATLLQCSTGPGSNPHDVAVVDPHKAYVTRYDRPELWIVDPEAASCAGFRRATIDLSPYGDADGLPEMDQMARVADRLFVSVERLDRTRGFAPSGPSALVVVDLATDTVAGTVELVGKNAFGDASGIVREPATGKLLLAAAGNTLHTGDGGIERIDPFALRSEGLVITEDELGGSVTDFVLVSSTRGYAVVLDDQLTNVLVAFDLEHRTVTRRLLSRDAYLPDIALGPDGLLWLADRSLPAPGVRLFDPADDRQITGRAIDVGLPPFAMAFLP